MELLGIVAVSLLAGYWYGYLRGWRDHDQVKLFKG